MEINPDLISKALIDTEISGLAKEEASRLVEGWLERLDSFPETQWKVLFVETPFYIQLEQKTFVVGQIDAGFQDDEGVVLCEWKSRRAPKLKKDGTAYAGDDAEGWLEDISNGPQLGVYALAGREGTFLSPDLEMKGDFLPFQLNLPEPRILVRAAVKSNPVVTWPADYRKGLFKMPGPLLDTVKAALLSEAASIRARRKLGVVPYSIPGIHCTNMYHRKCEYYENVCKPRLTPPATPVGWHNPADTAPDPGMDVCRILGLDVQDPELVVLTQSALQTHYQCAERGRIQYGGYFPKDGDQFELSVGSGLHKALASIYSQWPRK